MTSERPITSQSSFSSERTGTLTSNKILLVDDEPSIRELFSVFLSDRGYTLHSADSIEKAKEILAQRKFIAAIVDIMLPDGTGIDLIPEIRSAWPGCAIIMITGHADIPLAVEAMQKGADHFLAKPVQLGDLRQVLERSLETHVNGATGRRRGMDPLNLDHHFGVSKAIGTSLESAALAAMSDAPVLITGETGAGKGVLARWIHDRSPRATSPFVEVNCSSFRGELLASELFGHVRGAFTSAVQDRQGLLDAANGGTLFLDEIGDMDSGVQAQFLKVIEEKTYRPLGDVRERTSDFRLICATNRDLNDRETDAACRRDLLFRINVLPIHLPPLRERPEDIAGLAQRLLNDLGYGHGELSSDIIDLLTGYPWLGNVRELRNTMERGLLLARGQRLTVDNFSWLRHGKIRLTEKPLGELERLEYEAIRAALARHSGDVNQSAKALGISKTTLYRKLQKMKEQ